MQIDHNGKRIVLLGDPHLGRSFVHGVPLSRKGEREISVMNDFRLALSIPADIHVCMGDLFDKAVVAYDTICNAALWYEQACVENPDTQFVVLKGNHDWLRDLDRVSAFDVFTRMVRHLPNLLVVTDTAQIDDLAFFAWHPVVTAKEAVKWFAHCTLAFGHWDIESFGGSGDNLIPTAELAAIRCQRAYTGHIHKAQVFEQDGVEVHVTGSMQPYAHGEESDDRLYVTLSKTELDDAPPDTLKDRCVRLVLQPNEVLDREIDCLQLTVKKVTENDDDVPNVSLGDFDMEALFLRAFREASVSEKITERLLEQFANGRLSGDA